MKSSIKLFTSVILSIAGLMITTAMAHSSGGVIIKDAWVREAPPNAPVLAAYMTVENHTQKQKILTKASSSSFAKIEFHRTEMHQDMARMIQQKEVSIPAEGEVKFLPGGIHLMLMKPKKSFREGDHISLTFTFADGSTSIVNAKVKKASGGMDHSMHHDMKHGHHDEHSDKHDDKHNSGHNGSHNSNHGNDHGSMHEDSITPKHESSKHDTHHSH